MMIGGIPLQHLGVMTTESSVGNLGLLGPAKENCCKCKPECQGQRNDEIPPSYRFDNEDDDFDDDDGAGGLDVLPVFIAIFGLLCCCALIAHAQQKNNGNGAMRGRTSTIQKQEQEEGSDNHDKITLVEGCRRKKRTTLAMSFF